MPQLSWQNLPFEEAIAFFKQKVPLPSSAWDEIIDEAQDWAFMVAGLTKAEMLNDIYGAIERALADGTTLEEFTRSFNETAVKTGWEPPPGQEGMWGGWRMQLIYMQNLQSAYAAGRLGQMRDPDVAKQRPYWMWRHRDSRVPRPSHLALDGKVFRGDSIFWDVGYPPCGYNCFPPETLVATPQGWQQISILKTGSLVIGGSGNIKPVMQTHTRDYVGKLINVVTDDRECRATPNHRFLTMNGWIKAENLKPGDVLVQVRQAAHLNSSISNIDKMDSLIGNFNVSLPVDQSLVSHALNTHSDCGQVNVNPVTSDVKVVTTLNGLSEKKFHQQSLTKSWLGSVIGVPFGILCIKLPLRRTHFCPNFWSVHRGGGLQFFGGSSTSSAISLGVPSVRRSTFSCHLGKHSFRNFAVLLSSFRVVNPLSCDRLATVPDRNFVQRQQLHNSAIVDLKSIADLFDRQFLVLVETLKNLFNRTLLQSFNLSQRFVQHSIAGRDGNVEMSTKLREGGRTDAPSLADFSRRNTSFNDQDMEGFSNGAPLDFFNSLDEFRRWAVAHADLREVKCTIEIPYIGTVHNLAINEDESYCVEASVVHNCRCSVFSLSDRDVERRGLTVEDAPTEQVTLRDRLTNAEYQVPAINGDPIVEAGFNHAAGSSKTEQRQDILRRSLSRLPVALQKLINPSDPSSIAFGARPADFAASGTKKAASSGTKKPKNCKKGYSCGYACIAQNRSCGSPLAGQAANYAQWMSMQAGSSAATPAKVPTPAPAAATTATPAKAKRVSKKQTPIAPPPLPQPPSLIKTNDTELTAKRKDLVDRFGAKLVGNAENNVKRILDDTDVFVRVGSSATLETILGDRFRTSAELGVDSHQIPHLKGSYQKARNRTEAKVLGYDEKTTPPGDRPIYGYLGSQDINGKSHSDVARAYGSITLKLKPEVKERTTFTGADSFKSGIASQVKNDGTPPPPNAASLVSSTRHGYDKEKLPTHYPKYYANDSAAGGQLRAAAKAKSIDDLLSPLAVTGNAYMEAQVHGKVKPSDVAEIHFAPKGVGDRPTAKIAQFAKDNQVDLYVDGKKLSGQDVDDLIAPPKSGNRVNRLNNALEQEDYATVLKLAEDIHQDAKTIPMAVGERDRYLKVILRDSGYDGLPKIGTPQDVTDAWKDGGTLMVRGVNAGVRDRLEYLKQFQSGDYFVGKGVYGNGTYVGHAGTLGKGTNATYQGYTPATAKNDSKRAWADVAKHNYITAVGVTFRMALPKDANIGVQSQLNTEAQDIRRSMDAWGRSEKSRMTSSGATPKQIKAFNKSLQQAIEILQDEGRFAVVRGYDAVALNRSYEAKTFMNLLNRSKVVIQQDELPYVQAKKTGAA